MRHCRFIRNTLSMYLYYHQNTILLVDALNWEVTYKDLVNKVGCDSSNCECMMHRCANCCDIILIFDFTTHKGQTADRASLVTFISTCEECNNILISAIYDITKHSFFAKWHTNFLTAKKDSLKENEEIVLGDFAENCQFLVQDEIQSYHWSNEYCLLHQLVV